MTRELKTWAFWRAVLAELLGMTLFIFIGISAAVGDKDTGPQQEVKVALSFGLAIATLAQSLCHVSGAHLNPAITLATLISCQISVFRAVFYILAQMLGAVFASGIMYGVRPNTTDSLGVNKLNGVAVAQGFGIEFLATFQLVLCFIATTDKRRSDVTGSAPLAIGLSVGLGHLAAMRYTGCGINPARSFGPAVVMRAFENHWVYWIGPISGGLVAALVYDYLLHPKLGDLTERLKVLCYGSEDAPAQEPLLEGCSAAQWTKG
uniref:Aquaporin-1b n=1 Tax=Anguilla japonica TaxID=7937 RepID=F8WLE8_ANGJA|nr:aquaporin-1b [Anguilla japonica]